MMSPQIIFRFQFWFKLLLTGSALGGWLFWEMVYPVVPAIAQTTSNENLTLESRQQESYSVFIRRAEANAAVKVQALFDKDLLRTEVQLTVLGQHSLAIAPILTLRVSRQEWTKYPDPKIWSIYYPESSYLLDLYNNTAPVAPLTFPTAKTSAPVTDTQTMPEMLPTMTTMPASQVPAVIPATNAAPPATGGNITTSTPSTNTSMTNTSTGTPTTKTPSLFQRQREGKL